MTKYTEFVLFMDNLQKNKAELTSKLADAQDRVSLFTRELESAKAMIPAVDGKLKELQDKLKDNFTDIGLGAEHAIWVVRKSDYAGRVDTLAVALKEAQREFDALVLQNNELDYTPYAESATAEMNVEVKRLYKQLCNQVIATTEARKTYLEALADLNRIKNAGRNACESGQKSQSYAKINKIENAPEHFSINYRNFCVTETDVRAA